MKTLRIDIVSDVVCPWCAIGLVSLERALQRTQGAVAKAKAKHSPKKKAK